MDKKASCDVQLMSRYVQQKVVTGRIHAVLNGLLYPYCNSLLKVYFIHNDF